LHIFKNTKETDLMGAPEDELVVAKDKLSEADARSVRVKNTFIDDFIVVRAGDEVAEPIATRSVPPRLPVCTSILEGNEEHDLSPIKECAGEDVSPYLSTAASSDGSSPGSPRSSERDSPSLSFGVPPLADIEVRNTFIHFEDVPADERVVQSMPHDMFRQCLLSEASAVHTTSNPNVGKVPDASSRPVPLIKHDVSMLATGVVLSPGTQVVIDGLLKLPAFNGLRGTVQSLDEESGRYNILLSSPVGGHKTAKVKGDNLLVVSPPPAPCFEPTISLEQCESPLWAERSNVACTLLLASIV
jgi:hypothetical protein